MNTAATGEDLRVCRTADDQWKLTSSGEAAATGEDLRVCRTADDQWKLTSSEEHLPSASYCTANQLLTRSSVEDKLNMMAIIKKDLDEQPSQVVLWTVREEGTKQPYDIHDSYREYSSWDGYARHSNGLKWIHADMKMEIASKPKFLVTDGCVHLSST